MDAAGSELLPDSFYLPVISDSSGHLFPDNKLSHFHVRLQDPILFGNARYVCGLAELMLPPLNHLDRKRPHPVSKPAASSQGTSLGNKRPRSELDDAAPNTPFYALALRSEIPQIEETAAKIIPAGKGSTTIREKEENEPQKEEEGSSVQQLDPAPQAQALIQTAEEEEETPPVESAAPAETVLDATLLVETAKSAQTTQEQTPVEASPLSLEETISDVSAASRRTSARGG